MAEKAAEWEKKVVDAEKHASKVYEDEVARLEKQVEHTDKAEAREVKRVEREVALDAAFAKHHIEYLEKVVLHEAKRVDHAYAVLAEKQEKGESDKAIERAAEHAVKVEDDAEKHIAKVIERVAKHLERDAKAAASHVLKGLDKLGLDEEYLGKDVVADADRVAKALAKVVDKAEA